MYEGYSYSKRNNPAQHLHVRKSNNHSSSALKPWNLCVSCGRTRVGFEFFPASLKQSWWHCGQPITSSYIKVTVYLPSNDYKIQDWVWIWGWAKVLYHHRTKVLPVSKQISGAEIRTPLNNLGFTPLNNLLDFTNSKCRPVNVPYITNRGLNTRANNESRAPGSRKNSVISDNFTG